MKLQALAAAVAAVALLATACGGGKEEPTPPPADRTVQVTMGEMYFKPDVIRVKEGERIALEMVNEGAVEHEMWVGRQVHMEKGMPEGFDRDFFAGMRPHFRGSKAEMEREEQGTELEFKAGGKGTLTFTVPAGTRGEWEIGCFEPGHYQAGMKAKLVVE